MNKNSTGIFNTNPPSIATMVSDTPMIDSNGEEADIETAAVAPSTTKQPYFCSLRFVEFLICLIPVPFGVLLELHTLFEPHQRPIPYQIVDGTLVNAFMFGMEDKGETVPPAAMFCTAVAIPFVLQIILICAYNAKTAFDRGDMVHKTCCVYAMAIGLTQTFTNVAKLYCGYLRPIFLDHCEPDDNMECTSSYKTEQQVRVSFPSGHASMSVCGMLLFSYFLVDTFGYASYKRRMKKEGQTLFQPKLRRIASVLCYGPMIVAFFIGTFLFHLWQSQSECSARVRNIRNVLCVVCLC